MKNERLSMDQKRQKKLRNILYLFKFSSFLFLFKFISLKKMTKNHIRKLEDHYSEINLVVKGSGEKQILHSGFSVTPSEVLVNGIPIDPPSKTVTLVGDKSNVTLRFNTQIENCYQMFWNCEAITEIDLSKFDASKVTNMYWMFRDCTSLVKINFKNINTNSVDTMRGLFQGCSSLTSIDVSYLNTSKVTTMYYMFAKCPSLEYLDLTNFDTSNVQDMSYMFSESSNLKYVNLSSFDTSNVKDMQYMFSDCSSLKYADISNFNTNKVTTIACIFYRCPSLVYVNLRSFQFQGSVTTSSAFYTSSPNLKLCCEDTSVTTKLTSLTFDCTDDCFKNNIKIDESQNTCVEICEKYEYHNFCVDECPSGTLLNENICEDNKCLIPAQNTVECLGNTPEGYYLDSNDQIYKKCFPGCKFCNGPGDEINNNCIDYKTTPSTLIYYSTTQISTIFYKIAYETTSKSINNDNINYSSYTKFLASSEIINILSISEFASDSNEDNCDLYKILQKIIWNNTINNYISLDHENQDEILKNIQKIIKEGFNISYIDNGNIPSLTIGNITYTVTSTLIHEVNKDKNYTIVDLGLCENKLKVNYNISLNDSLYLLIVNTKIENIPKVEYEVFYPFSSNNFSTLNLSFCKDMKIDISFPVDISINDIDKYNKSSGLYNDICYTLKTESDTDITLKDRQNEYRMHPVCVSLIFHKFQK